MQHSSPLFSSAFWWTMCIVICRRSGVSGAKDGRANALHHHVFAQSGGQDSHSQATPKDQLDCLFRHPATSNFQPTAVLLLAIGLSASLYFPIDELLTSPLMSFLSGFAHNLLIGTPFIILALHSACFFTAFYYSQATAQQPCDLCRWSSPMVTRWSRTRVAGS